MLSVHEIESLRRSQAMAPPSPSDVHKLLETCQELARERQQIANVLADLPDSVGVAGGTEPFAPARGIVRGRL